MKYCRHKNYHNTWIFVAEDNDVWVFLYDIKKNPSLRGGTFYANQLNAVHSEYLPIEHRDVRAPDGMLYGWVWGSTGGVSDMILIEDEFELLMLELSEELEYGSI